MADTFTLEIKLVPDDNSRVINVDFESLMSYPWYLTNLHEMPIKDIDSTKLLMQEITFKIDDVIPEPSTEVLNKLAPKISSFVFGEVSVATIQISRDALNPFVRVSIPDSADETIQLAPPSPTDMFAYLMESVK